MEILETSIPDVKVFAPHRFHDERGFFTELWNKGEFIGTNVCTDFVQDNFSLSILKGTIRGLHYQVPPFAQAKLVRCGRGSILDVAVDIRKESEYFGKWVSEILSFENGKQLYIPEGFMHGFITLEDDTEVSYKCSDFYSPSHERAIRYDDPELGIDWLDLKKDDIQVSDKDMKAPFFSEITSPF